MPCKGIGCCGRASYGNDKGVRAVEGSRKAAGMAREAVDDERVSMVISDHRDSELSSGGSVVGVMSVAEEGDEGAGQYWR